MCNKVKRLVSILFILLSIVLVATCFQGQNSSETEQGSVQAGITSLPVVAGAIDTALLSQEDSSPISGINDRVASNAGKAFPYQRYVTPDDQAIEALTTRIDGAEDAYALAVQWTYVSEKTLNRVADKWLKPQEFLANTPYFPTNPVKGEAVSDCEEQAYVLVSLLRAVGVRAEEVRVVMGKVDFDGTEMGHAWVELFTDGQWLILDPSSGPYWDDEAGEIVNRQGHSFDYYLNHPYPVIEIWVYGNDIYYLDLRDNAGNAPDSWN